MLVVPDSTESEMLRAMFCVDWAPVMTGFPSSSKIFATSCELVSAFLVDAGLEKSIE
jgi:hypothetical protein